MSSSTYHTPVLEKETLDFLNIKKDHWYIDCTLGGGGHTEEILKQGGNVIGIDMDQDALNEVSKKLDQYIKSGNLILKHSNFSNIDVLAQQEINGVIPANAGIQGILFDLGVSSHQLDDAYRGFSFSKDAPLDMRMGQLLAVKASDLVNGLNSGELTELFEKLGEEKSAKLLGKAIVKYREQNGPITSTKQLADLIQKTLFFSKEKIHPATRVFQALRIAVNDELNSLKETLPKAFDLLSPGGRLVVISFHSLEDRIVKNFFKELGMNKKAKILTDKPLEPIEEEIYNNPRSRSSKLRVIEKI